MSGPDDIDALLVARRVLASPKTFRVSTHEELAMAGCLVALNSQLDAAVNAVAVFIVADDALAASKTPDGYQPLALMAARHEAFNTLKTTFEQEFNNVRID